MKYVPPIGATDPNAPYVTENLAAGIEGSPVAAEAIEHPMREIMSVITGAGLVPDVEQLDQLKAAIAKMITDRAAPLATTVNITDFAQSFAASGWQKLPSGLIVQWGTANVPANNVAYTQSLPIAFPTLQLSAASAVASAAYSSAIVGVGLTLTQITLFNASPMGAQNVRWIAIGH